MQNFRENIAATEMDMIPIQNDLALNSLFLNTKCIWPLVSKIKDPVACCMKSEGVSSTYLSESFFF
nr:unnamed protein product [Callosobruchus chinensis]